jgi:hypothetical protein
MTAWPTGSARTHTGAERTRHHRPTGPTGAHARGKWSGKDDHSFGTAGTIHAVVRTERVIMPGDEGTGEEDDRDNENSAGDNHHPGRSLIKTRMLRYARRGRRHRRRRAGGRRRRELGLGCLSHPLIMPTGAPAIKHRGQKSRMSYQTDALAPPTQNRAGCLSS